MSIDDTRVPRGSFDKACFSDPNLTCSYPCQMQNFNRRMKAIEEILAELPPISAVHGNPEEEEMFRSTVAAQVFLGSFLE